MLAEQGSQAGPESQVQVPGQAEQAVLELASQGSQEPELESAALVAQAQQAALAQEREPGSQETESARQAGAQQACLPESWAHTHARSRHT